MKHNVGVRFLENERRVHHTSVQSTPVAVNAPSSLADIWNNDERTCNVYQKNPFDCQLSRFAVPNLT